MVTPMTRTSRIVGLLFLLMVAAFLSVVVTDGHPETLLGDLEALRRTYIR